LVIGAVFFVHGPATPVDVVTVSSSPRSMLGAFAMCFIPIFFTYGGYQHTMNFGNDIKNAKRTMPRAIFYGITMVMFLYLAVNYSYYKILGFNGLAHSPTIAAEISGLIFGSLGSKIVSVIMFISVMAYVNVSVMFNPRIYYAMAEDGVLPGIFKRLNSRTQVQEFAVTLFCAFILLTLFFMGSFQAILTQVMFFDSISLIAAAAAIFILRYRAVKQGEPDNIFKMKGYPFLPAIFILVYTAVNISVFYANPAASKGGFVLFILGFPLYYFIKFVTKDNKAI